jgi:hypothetical protein
VTLSGSCSFLGTHFGADGGQDLLLDGDKVRSVIRRRNKIGQRMLAHDARLMMAENALEFAFGRGDWFGRAGKTWEEYLGIGDLPADVNRGEQVVTVAREALGQFVFEILDSLIEAMDVFDPPRPARLEPRGGDLPVYLAKARHDHHFLLAHLEAKQQQGKNNQQKGANNDDKERLSIHECLFLRGREVRRGVH